MRMLAVKGKLIDSELVQRLTLQFRPLVPEIRFADSLDAILSLGDLSCYDILLLNLDLGGEECRDALGKLRLYHPHVANIIIASHHEDGNALRVIAQGTHEFAVPNGGDRDALCDFIWHSIGREQTYELLDLKQKSLQAIFDAVPIGMLLIDENMVVRRANDTIRRITRRSFGRIIGRPLSEALNCTDEGNECGGSCGSKPGCRACELGRTVEEVFEQEHSVREREFQTSLKAGDSESRPWFSVSAEPTEVEGCRYVVVAIEDITDRKEAEQKLRESMEIKSQFISTVSHELRTPLACMKEAIAVVLDGAAGPVNDRQKTFLDIAARNIARLTGLINDVLDFQKLDAGKMELSLKASDLGAIVEDACNTMRSLADKEDIELDMEVAADLPPISIDGDKITQVLTNLISNAIKFTSEGGRISVAAKKHGEELVVSVSDSGIGIPKEALPRIFDRFYRVQRPGKHVQGTGLGLAIVSRIVMMHGGRMEVESVVDKGSVFTVFLPLKEKCAQADITQGVSHLDVDT